MEQKNDNSKSNNKIFLDPSKQYVRYQITIYNDEELEIMKTSDKIKYWCYGIEWCPKTERKHYQGYFELIQKSRFKTIKEKIFKTSHFEIAHKEAQANINYCKKQNNEFFEKCDYSTVNKQGQRTDLKNIAQRFLNGETTRDIIIEDDRNLYKVASLLKAENLIKNKPRNFKPKVLVYWGLPGCGKSYKAKTENPDFFIVSIPQGGNIWWDGYDPLIHKTIIFDEFTGWIPFTLFKLLCDDSAYQVPVKGSFLHFRPEKIIFTSNRHPLTWYRNITDLDKKAFERRIDKVIYFDQVYKESDKKYEDNTPLSVIKQQEEILHDMMLKERMRISVNDC